MILDDKIPCTSSRNRYQSCRYLCCTLWTDFAIRGSADEGMYQAEKWMHDYKYIRMERARYA
jgi:hypothetical protein